MGSASEREQQREARVTRSRRMFDAMTMSMLLLMMIIVATTGEVAALS